MEKLILLSLFPGGFILIALIGIYKCFKKRNVAYRYTYNRSLKRPLKGI